MQNIAVHSKISFKSERQPAVKATSSGPEGEGGAQHEEADLKELADTQCELDKLYRMDEVKQIAFEKEFDDDQVLDLKNLFEEFDESHKFKKLKHPSKLKLKFEVWDSDVGRDDK